MHDRVGGIPNQTEALGEGYEMPRSSESNTGLLQNLTNTITDIITVEVLSKGI